MAITYTTRIENLERTTADGKVTVVHWSMHGTDGTYSIGTTTSGLALDGEVSVAFKDLTPEICEGWVTAALGAEKVQEIQAAIAANLAEQAAPTRAMGTPWNVD